MTRFLRSQAPFLRASLALAMLLVGAWGVAWVVVSGVLAW